MINRRNLLATSLAVPFIGRTARAAKTPVLVELFTSQGCSSCPPADKLAGKLAGRDDVIIVSLNVDYWDYLGWKDTLAKPEFTRRQKDYAQARGDGQVYTPQMVINGSAHVVGSNASSVDDAIASASSAQVPLTIEASRSQLTVKVGDSTSVPEATLWLLAVAPEVKVNVERGENAGSSITYHRVVRNLVPAGMWMGGAKEFALPRNAVVTTDTAMLVAVLQKDMTGAVLGVTTAALPST